MAALEDYTLLTIRDQLAREFGMDTGVAEQKTLLDDKINQAYHWIVRRRQNWPWLETELVVNIQPAITGTAQFWLGSVGISLAAGSIQPRFIVQNGDVAGDLIDGYMLVGTAAPTGTLDAQFLAGTSAGTLLSYTAARGYYQLPTDFSRINTLHTTDQPLRDISYAHPHTYEKIRRRLIPINLGSPLIYTVVPDPLKSDGNMYLSVYPYPTERQTLRGSYFRDPQNLSADADIPLIPRKNRLVLFYFAALYIAVKMKRHDTVVKHYQGLSLQSLQDMLAEYQFSDDLDVAFQNRIDPFSGSQPLDLPITE